MYVSKQKKLMSKCRACGNENLLDDSHRAGTHLMRHVPTNMDEIDVKKGSAEAKAASQQAQAGIPKTDGAGEEKKEKLSKKSKKEVEEDGDNGGLTGLTLESEEIGK